jgi:hypothetical protein
VKAFKSSQAPYRYDDELGSQEVASGIGLLTYEYVVLTINKQLSFHFYHVYNSH